MVSWPVLRSDCGLPGSGRVPGKAGAERQPGFENAGGCFAASPVTQLIEIIKATPHQVGIDEISHPVGASISLPRTRPSRGPEHRFDWYSMRSSPCARKG